MDTTEITRQTTGMVRNIHPTEETTLLNAEEKGGIILLQFRKKFTLDRIVLSQEFGAAFTLSGKFVYLVTKTPAMIESVSSEREENLESLLATIKATTNPAPENKEATNQALVTPAVIPRSC